jgi:GntR family transcriptional regulator/MocR family aminotransferase
LHTGEINRHTLKISKIYEERRAFIAKLIRSELNDYVDFSMPDGGLALWLTVNKKINMQTLQNDAELEKVRFIAGAEYSLAGESISAIRLGFAKFNNEETILGIKRLKKAFERQTNQLL